VSRDWGKVGASPYVSDVWTRGMLRLIPWKTRHGSFHGDGPPYHALGRAWRVLEVVLRGRGDALTGASLIGVTDQSGRWVDGSVSFDRHETRWRLQPSQVWGSGKHELVIDATLEDVAGNNLQGLLDHSVRTPLSAVASLSRSFEPRL